MLRQLLGLSLVVVSLSSAQAAFERKTMSEYWAEVELPYTLYTKIASPRFCKETLQGFLGCVHGVNALLEAAGQKSLILPDSQLADSKVVATVEAFDGASLVQLAPPVKEKSLSASIARRKLEQRAGYNAWKKYYEDGKFELDFETIYGYLDKNVMTNATNESELVAEAFNLFLGTVDDPHTRIEPEQYFRDETATSEQSFTGIGIQIRVVEDQAIVLQPIEGGPAHQAGVKARDVITAIDGVTTKGLALEDISKRIKGEKGTTVRLTLLRKDKVVEISIVRATVVTKNVSSKILPETRKKIGYIKLSDFMQGDPGGELKKALVDLQAQNIESVIFDLRGNPGGLMNQAVSVANLFAGPGQTVVSTRELKTRKTLSTEKTKEDATTNLPVVVLVDGGSASAAEVVSGALQDWKRALVVGVRSFGKGSVQGVGNWALADGVLMIRTQATFHLPSGRSNQILGIIPDIEAYSVPNPTEDEKFALREEDIYMNALPVSSEAFKTLQPEVVKSVQECLAKTGQAKTRFDASNGNTFLPDYQLLVAQDVANCR